MRIVPLFVAVAVAGMALLPEAPVVAGAGMAPATAYAPAPARAIGADVKTFEITARRFAFEPATITVAVGDRVHLRVRSADGVHGIGIRKFKASAFVPRGGAVVDLEFEATSAGTFPIICTEACGDGHTEMRGALVVTAIP